MFSCLMAPKCIVSDIYLVSCPLDTSMHVFLLLWLPSIWNNFTKPIFSVQTCLILNICPYLFFNVSIDPLYIVFSFCLTTGITRFLLSQLMTIHMMTKNFLKYARFVHYLVKASLVKELRLKLSLIPPEPILSCVPILFQIHTMKSQIVLLMMALHLSIPIDSRLQLLSL